MTGDTIVSLVWFSAALVLVGSALIVRRLPARRTAALALAWAAIFATAFLLARMMM